MNRSQLYIFFKSRYEKLMEKYEEMKIVGHPDLFIIKSTLDLNEKLMKIFK